jgi:hypothetical protein
VDYNHPAMHKTLALIFMLALLIGCNKPSTPSAEKATAPSSGQPASSNDAVQQKLADYAGSSAKPCGRLDVQAPPAELSAASSCAMDAAQNKRPFYVAYDMPGMSLGVAGNSDGKLFTVQSQGGDAGMTSGSCPSQIRVASSGRVTCFAPGDMGSMGAGHQGGMPTGKSPHGSAAPAEPK